MSWYKKYLKTASGEQDYSWVSISLPKDVSKKTIAFSKTIPERELFIKQDDEGEDIHGKGWKFGVEDDPHITVKWGITTKDVRKVKKAIDGLKGGTVKLSIIDVFENEEYDVLKVNIISPSLRKLNKALSENLNTEDTFKEYNPHATLAYVKCGNGKKYKGNSRFKSISFEFNEVMFEDYNDKKYPIKLSE